MKDRFEREIDYLRISVTDRCNLRCVYCMPETAGFLPREELLSWEELTEIVSCAAGLGIRHLKVTGGEPLVRQGCPELIGRLKAIPGIETVTLTTNGLLLEEQLPALADAGVDGINISLDTLRPGRYRELTGCGMAAEESGTDGPKRVLRAMRAAIGVGIPVKLNAVSLKPKKSWEEIWELTELARRYPVDVRFIEWMPIGRGAEMEALDHRELLRRMEERYRGMENDGARHGWGPAVYRKIPGFLGSVGFISAIHGKFCAGCNRMRLTARGYLKPCLCYAQGEDLRRILRSGGTPGERRVRLEEAFQSAVRQKMREHCFEEPQEITEKGGMNGIGG